MNLGNPLEIKGFKMSGIVKYIYLNLLKESQMYAVAIFRQKFQRNHSVVSNTNGNGCYEKHEHESFLLSNVIC